MNLLSSLLGLVCYSMCTYNTLLILYTVCTNGHMFYLGTMELPIEQITPPPKQSRLLRDPDSVFIGNLKKKMIADPSAPGAAPMAVICKDIEGVGSFDVKFKNVYK